MVDATLPTVAFIVANSLAGLRVGVYAAVVAAVLIFLVRLVRRESVQQAVSGLLGVGIAVAIAAASGQARNFFVPGIVRNVVIGVVLLGSLAVRRPLVGVVAEFLSPSHLGAMASPSLPGLRRQGQPPPPVAPPGPGGRGPDPEPEQHWRDDSRMLRAYGWLTVLWAGTFFLRAGVQWLFYERNDVDLLGTVTVILGLPLTAVVLGITLWVVARLHRHRAGAPADPPPGEARPAT